jgi:hypothetical protein
VIKDPLVKRSVSLRNKADGFTSLAASRPNRSEFEKSSSQILMSDHRSYHKTTAEKSGSFLGAEAQCVEAFFATLSEFEMSGRIQPA